jgi:hypothetical protein
LIQAVGWPAVHLNLPDSLQLGCSQQQLASSIDANAALQGQHGEPAAVT